MSAQLSCTTRGEGPRALVLLHGFLGSGRNLASLARRLSDDGPSLRIVLPDLTGHGTSPPLPDGADLSTLARDVVRLLDHLGLERADLCGHSLGGRVALVCRAEAPARIGRVTLLDIAPGPIRRDATDLDRVLEALLAAPDSAPSRAPLRAFLLERGVSEALADWLLMNVVVGPTGLSWRIDRQRLGALNATTRPADLWPLVATHDPLLSCVRGGRSRFVSDADVRRLEERGALVETIPEAGHFVHVDTQPALLDILARLHSR